MRSIVFILFPALVMAAAKSPKGQANDCFKDLVLFKDPGVEWTLIHVTAAFNSALLILNLTILFGVLRYLRPMVGEIRKQTFVIMDCVLSSFIPASIREVVGCQPEVGGDGAKTVTLTSKTGDGTKGAESKMTTTTGGNTTGNTTGTAAGTTKSTAGPSPA